MSDPTNSDDTIDSRDIIKRIEELESELEGYTEAVDTAREELAEQMQPDADALEEDKALIDALAACESELAEWDETNGEELKALKSLANEAEGCADWQHGEALIRDSYFKDYAQELAEDCGTINGTEGWPLNCIDWEKAANELQMDYTAVDFDGVTYWIRS